jgi:hypothetical protein
MRSRFRVSTRFAAIVTLTPIIGVNVTIVPRTGRTRAPRCPPYLSAEPAGHASSLLHAIGHLREVAVGEREEGAARG